jgi:integrase
MKAKLPGSVRELRPGVFQIRWDGPSDEFGGRRQYSERVYGTERQAVGRLIARYGATVTGTAQQKSASAPTIARSRAPLPAAAVAAASAPTLGDYMTGWLGSQTERLRLGNADFAGKTLERYHELNARQIIPFLGDIRLDDLTPRRVADWHLELLRGGSRHGRPLAARSVRAAHQLLRRGYARACALELVIRNPLGQIRPPRVPPNDTTQILTAPQIVELLQRLRRSSNPTKQRLFPIAAAAVATGARRGELLATRWGDVDLDKRVWKIERSLQQTKAGLAYKRPKTSAGRRSIAIGAELVAILAEHRRRRVAHQFKFGLGRLGDDALVFADAMGEPLAPDTLSRDWANAIRDFSSLPSIPFHGLRHTRASAMIAAGMTIVDVAAQLGHSSPSTTLKVYGHLIDNRGAAQAAAIADDMLRGTVG